MLKKMRVIFLITIIGFMTALLDINTFAQDPAALADPRPSPVVDLELEAGRLIIKAQVGRAIKELTLPDGVYKNKEGFWIAFSHGSPFIVQGEKGLPMKVTSVKIEKDKMMLLKHNGKFRTLPDGHYSGQDWTFIVHEGMCSKISFPVK